MAWVQAVCDRRGSAPLSPGSGDVAVDLGAFPRDVLPAAILCARHPVAAAVWAGDNRCPLKGLTLPTIARIATVRDSHREAAVFGRRLPPRALNPHVVRIAPLHDASIATCPKAHAEICTLGRSYRLMHAEELRAGPVLWPEPSNAPCVHDLGGFVKRTIRNST